MNGIRSLVIRLIIKRLEFVEQRALDDIDSCLRTRAKITFYRENHNL
jgi:hypothetical protein